MINTNDNLTLTNDDEIINDNIGAKKASSEGVKPDGRISDKELSDLKDFYTFSKKCSIGALICLILFFLIIPLLIGLVIEIAWAIKCLTLKNDELKQECILWGILSLIILPIIPIFIMKSKALNTIQKYDPNFKSK